MRPSESLLAGVRQTLVDICNASTDMAQAVKQTIDEAKPGACEEELVRRGLVAAFKLQQADGTLDDSPESARALSQAEMDLRVADLRITRVLKGTPAAVSTMHLPTVLVPGDRQAGQSDCYVSGLLDVLRDPVMGDMSRLSLSVSVGEVGQDLVLCEWRPGALSLADDYCAIEQKTLANSASVTASQQLQCLRIAALAAEHMQRFLCKEGLELLDRFARLPECLGAYRREPSVQAPKPVFMEMMTADSPANLPRQRAAA